MRKHYPLNSSGDEDAGQMPWTDGVPSTGTEGSYFGHALFTDAEAEILSAIDAAGLTRNGSDLTQLIQAAARGIWLGVFGGTSGALTGTLPNNVVIPSLQAGVRVRGIAASDFTGTGGTLKITGIGTAIGVMTCPLVGADGTTALASGAWKAGQFLTFDIDASGNARFGGSGGSAGSAVTLVTSQTLWVRLDGNDANDGSANDSGHALATILAAINASAKYTTTGNPVVIRLGQTNTSANPYAAPGKVSLSGRSIQILGDTAAQGSYVISGAGASNGDSPIHVVNGFMAVSGVTLINTGTTSTTAQAGIFGALSLDRITFQATGSNPQMHTGAFGGSLFLGTGLIFASSMGGWINASGGYVVIEVTATITFQGNPAWSVAGVNAINTSLVTLSQLGALTIVGSATGVRYVVDAVSRIAVNGAGVNLFPGSIAGSGSSNNYG